MRTEAPFWHDYPAFSETVLSLEALHAGDACTRLLDLPVGSRLHLFTALSFGIGSLPSLTDYKLRSFGLDVAESTQRILRTELLILSSDYDAVSRVLTKEDLIKTCQGFNLAVKRSWTKADLLKTIISVYPGFVSNTAKSRAIVTLNPLFEARTPLNIAPMREPSRAFQSVLLCTVNLRNTQTCGRTKSNYSLNPYFSSCLAADPHSHNPQEVSKIRAALGENTADLLRPLRRLIENLCTEQIPRVDEQPPQNILVGKRSNCGRKPSLAPSEDQATKAPCNPAS